MLRKPVSIPGIVLLLIMSLVSISFAQGGTPAGNKSGKITGTLLSKKTQKPMAGIWLHLLRYGGKDAKGNDLIELFVLNGAFPRARSDASGHFTFNQVPAGRYIIKTGSENSFSTTDGGASALQTDKGAVLILKLETRQVMDLGNITLMK